jgi:hypothetical protein
VPPEAAFNNRRILHTAFEKFLRSENLDELPARVQQRGAGAYMLCEKCNSDTRSWYGGAYAGPGLLHAGDAWYSNLPNLSALGNGQAGKLAWATWGILANHLIVFVVVSFSLPGCPKKWPRARGIWASWNCRGLGRATTRSM